MFTLIFNEFISFYFLVSFIIIPVCSTSSQSAVCFLTRKPYSSIVQFGLELAQNITSIDVFISVDDNSIMTLPMLSNRFQYLQFNESICTKYGFQGSNMFGSHKICSAWDKTIYYFSRQVTHHSFVWFIEEDVFIPSVQAFISLHELYSTSYDLVTAGIEYNINGNLASWYHWYLAPGTFVLPWAHGMVCAVGCSRRLLSTVNEYVKWRGHLTFLEFLFHTLAIQENNMKIVTPFELDTINYRQTYTFEQIQARPYNWWHPMKNVEQQHEWRKRLTNNRFIDKKIFLKTLHSVSRQLNTDDVENSMLDIEKTISSIPAQFEILKGQMKASSRHQLRNRFLRLTTNQSNHVTSVALLLADHAFKLPLSITLISLRDRNIIKNKTMTHVKLEEIIDYNKRIILRLMNKESLTQYQISIIDQLRNETTQFIGKLTHEIQCELKAVNCNPTREWIDIDYKFDWHAASNLIYLVQTVLMFMLFFTFMFYRYKKRIIII